MANKLFEKYIQAVNEYMKAKQEHDRAFEEYLGYSWNWEGGLVIEQMEKAEKKMQEYFNTAVDERVKELLAKSGIN